MLCLSLLSFDAVGIDLRLRFSHIISLYRRRRALQFAISLPMWRPVRAHFIFYKILEIQTTAVSHKFCALPFARWDSARKNTSKVDFVVFDKRGKKKDFNACFFDVFLVTTNRQRLEGDGLKKSGKESAVSALNRPVGAVEFSIWCFKQK